MFTKGITYDNNQWINRCLLTIAFSNQLSFSWDLLNVIARYSVDAGKLIITPKYYEIK